MIHAIVEQGADVRKIEPIQLILYKWFNMRYITIVNMLLILQLIKTKWIRN